ncbi:hypothetical protein EII34_03595 [Arachnia propionica]|uniref:Uncharacterized protein n=1 Tax=Arachnia propionica TaxID=1750 RepID=A0A3P1T9Z9_9ACTN|nr:hypothetical protein [Arachnia propionica]RRD06219.1 hypothetical protein EII34_03595 [Arachnia propionica]
MTDNAKNDYAKFYPEDFPWDGAFIIHDIQRKDWWPYRPIDGVVDALWLLGDDAAPDGLFGTLIKTWGRTVGWFLAGLSDPHLDEEKISWPFTDEAFNGHRVGRVRYEALQGIFLFHRHLECWQIPLRPKAFMACCKVRCGAHAKGGGWRPPPIRTPDPPS